MSLSCTSEPDRDAVRAFRAARAANPEWSKQISAQLSATMTAVLRDYPFSWLPREHVLNWMRSL